MKHQQHGIETPNEAPLTAWNLCWSADEESIIVVISPSYDQYSIMSHWHHQRMNAWRIEHLT
jgi:hypothetical protein